jgi:monoamine oxidase
VFDVAVLGAGLGGLSAARDLVNDGADVIVLEARERPGGRVEAVELPDGRSVQAGGEVFGHGHVAYRELVDELGLATTRSYVAEPGEMTWGLVDGVHVGDAMPWMTAQEISDAERVDRAFHALAADVDASDPWSHPNAAALDAISVGAWLRSIDALPAVRRRYELSSLSLSCDGPERTSLLADLRKHALFGGDTAYDLDVWEGFRVADGSAAVPLAMAAQLAGRIRYGAITERIDITPGRVTVTLTGGETIEAEAVVCAIPTAPLRDVAITGLSDARLASLRAQRNALAAKVVVAYEEPFWRASGQNGLSETEWLFGSTWPQRDGVLSLLVPPERLAPFIAAPPLERRATVLQGLRALYGDRAADPVAMFERMWGVDPFTRGYIASWAPGDLMRVGPLHGTHEPPFYVAGSDHWVVGYMEGAVKTGRDAARSALGAPVA